MNLPLYVTCIENRILLTKCPFFFSKIPVLFMFLSCLVHFLGYSLSCIPVLFCVSEPGRLVHENCLIFKCFKVCKQTGNFRHDLNKARFHQGIF